MGLIQKKVLGVGITINSKEYILEYIRKYLAKIQNPKSKIQKNSIKPLIIITPNPEIISYAQKDVTFRKIVNCAQINIPDGAGTVWALKKLYKININRLSGIDLMDKLCRLAAGKRFRVGVIGGRGEVALKALECLKNTYANLSGWADKGPDFQISNLKSQISNQFQISNFKKEIVRISQRIIREKTDIVFVGMGCPKQEYFIEKLKVQSEKFKVNRPLVMMTVGGALDYLSGRVPRAPEWMRDRGLEWLYRLIREPRRIKRQILGAEFFWKIFTSN